jgi:hypothetical protein
MTQIYPEMIPADLVQVCPMGPSLSQKEKDGTITEDEKIILRMLEVHEVLSEDEPTRI